MRIVWDQPFATPESVFIFHKNDLNMSAIRDILFLDNPSCISSIARLQACHQGVR